MSLTSHLDVSTVKESSPQKLVGDKRFLKKLSIASIVENLSNCMWNLMQNSHFALELVSCAIQNILAVSTDHFLSGRGPFSHEYVPYNWLKWDYLMVWPCNSYSEDTTKGLMPCKKHAKLLGLETWRDTSLGLNHWNKTTPRIMERPLSMINQPYISRF